MIDYRPSTCLPIVISAPHGGSALPTSIPDRTSGCFEPDELSFELGEEILSEFARKGTGVPAFIALKLHRLKLDANRSRATAANDDLSLAAWDDYHCSIENALHECLKIFDFCLLIDLHGQSHRPHVTELGYLLHSADLLHEDAALDAAPPRRTSVDTLLNGRGNSIAALIRGDKSLGGLLSQRGFPCTPSPDFPQPELPYFHGGYSLCRYAVADAVPPDFSPLHVDSQRWAKRVSAIQIETAWALRQTQDERKAFAVALVDAVFEFLAVWKAWRPPSQQP